jgi:digeranylgeranylglycerophospholipid reductase
LREGGAVCGVRVRSGGQETEVQARVVIAADGVESQVGRWAGLDTQLPLQDIMVCAQYLMAGIDIDPTCTYFYLGHQWAPGGYAWIFPKGEGRANVGLGVQADIWQGVEGADKVLDFLTRFIEERPFLARGYPVTLVAGNVPVALPPTSLVTDGLLLVGDAARQVNPLTGGGIGNAMQAGKLAAETAAAAIAEGDLSASSLARYEQEWRSTTGRKMARNYRLRQRFPPAQRDDERFVNAFVLAAGQ